MINQQGYDVTQDEFGLTEEEKRRRREAMSGLVGGQPISDITSNYLGDVNQQVDNRFNQLQQRMGVEQGPMGPVMPEQIQQERQSQLPIQQTPTVQAMSPDQFQQFEQQRQATLPQPSEGVQVAGPTQTPQQTVQATWMDELAKAGNDPQKLAQFMSTAQTPEARQAAGRMIAQQYNQTQKQQEAEKFANQAVQSGDLLPLMKRIQQEKGEGSYLKAYLYGRLGLNELAKDEQQRLGAGTTYQVAYDQAGNKALMEVTAQGLPVKGYNEKLQELTPEEFGKFAVGAAPKHAFQMPSVHGTPVQRTNAQGQVETGLMIYDPISRTNYVQVGNQRQDTTGWTTMAQTPQSVYQAAGAQKLGGMAAETGQQQPALAPMAGTQTTGGTAGGTAGGTTGGTTGAQTTDNKTQVTAQTTSTGGVKLTTQKTAGGGQVVTQQPGESYASYQQRKKAAEEQTAANIQAGKELRVAEEKPPAEAKGKNEAKDINNQRYANETYGLIKPISDAIKQSTGSGLGTKVDQLAGVFGVGTTGAQAKAQLDVLGYNLVANVPRFEGAQSDRDVALYERAAGDIANSEKPINVRLAALQTIVSMLKKYDKKKENDWTFSAEAAPQGQIKIIKREKVQ